MTDPDDTDSHDFTPEDVDTLLGVVEPPSVDPTSSAERADRIARVMAELVDAGADPEVLRFLAAQAWHAGWVACWDERGAPGGGISRNPYDTAPS
ncbi:MAG TPA: hypothetical protein VIC62_16485 [Nakamurella sp.]|jgi:hypothetical protein